MRIGIFGGSFDPPHLGHMRAAAAALERLALDRLLLMPAGHPPHKTLAEGGAAARQRYDMTCLMADGLAAGGRAAVSRMELDRAGMSYTADTLEALAAKHPGAELWLLTGSDMFLSLQAWHQPTRIFARAGVVGFSRTRDDGTRLAAQADALTRDFGARVCVLPLSETMEVSSTHLRRLLAEGSGKAADYLWPAVYGYILRHRLYGADRDLTALTNDELRAAALSMVKYKRAAHIRGTEDEAVRLARRWGGDERGAARAAILHDCTKYLTLDEQLALCAKHGVQIDALEQTTEKLLHAKTAAALARDVYGENDAVVDAIFSHTTGAPRMGLLQKILYVADYIEPTRDFPEVAPLRAMAYEDLDRTVGACLALSAQEIAEKGRVLHPNTAEALSLARRLGYV